MSSKGLKLIKFLFWALVLFFLLNIYINNLPKIDFKQIQINYYCLLTSVVFFIIGTFCQNIIWYYITLKYNINLSFSKSTYIWIISLLIRYIPGKVVTYLGRYYYYNQELKHKVENLNIAFLYSFVTEIVSSIVATTLIFSISSFFISDQEVAIAYLRPYKISAIILFFILLIFFIHRKYLKKILAIIFRNKVILEFDIRPFYLFKLVLLYSFCWIFFGTGFLFLIKSFYKLNISVFYATSAFALASIISYLSVITPSGIGVREGVLVLMLRIVSDLKIASLISVIARLWTITSEFFLILFIYIFTKASSIYTARDIFDKETSLFI